ncbi:MAG: hypothetical protein ACJ8AO_21740 [Gemmatimonadaceae bacterium]
MWPFPRPVRSAAVGASLAALATLAACADSPTEPSAQIATDAVVAADLAAAEGEAVAADLGDFVDPSFSASRTVARTVTYFDAAGAEMPAYDASLTASVRFDTHVDGARSGTGPNGGTFTTAVHRERSRTVTGLAGAETQRTWNGTGAANDTTTHVGALNTRVYTKAVRDTATDVVVLLPRASNPYPASGQVVHHVTGKVTVTGARSETRTFERRVVVTFNGTAAVPVTVGSASCTLHLDTRSVDGCSR